MKLTPSSIARRTMRIPRRSSTCGKPRCQPPRPIADTRSPVLPRTRYGIAACAGFSDMSFSFRSASVIRPFDAARQVRREVAARDAPTPRRGRGFGRPGTRSRPRERRLDRPEADRPRRHLDVPPVPRPLRRAENSEVVALVRSDPAPERDPLRLRRLAPEVPVADDDVDRAAVG